MFGLCCAKKTPLSAGDSAICDIVHNGEQVLDFTPEWDYTAGGTKLLLTGSVLPGARTEAHTRPLYIKFDQTEVPHYHLTLMDACCKLAYGGIHLGVQILSRTDDFNGCPFA